MAWRGLARQARQGPCGGPFQMAITPPLMADHIELWSVDRLSPYERNARTHSDEQVAQIAASIIEFGFASSIIAGTRPAQLSGEVCAWRARVAPYRQIQGEAFISFFGSHAWRVYFHALTK